MDAALSARREIAVMASIELTDGPCAGQVVQVELTRASWPAELYVSPVMPAEAVLPAARWRYVWGPRSGRYVWDGGRSWPVALT